MFQGEGITPDMMPGFLQSDDAYPFRLDGSFSQIRRVSTAACQRLCCAALLTFLLTPAAGQAGERGNIPHAYPRVGPLFGYQCHNRKIYSGLTRVLWELSPVGEHDQGTLVAPGR